MLSLKSENLATLEAFKKASRAAATQIKENTPFCAFSDIELLDSSKKPHVVKPFLAVGPLNMIMPLLKDLKGTKKFLASGVCSLDQGKIHLLVQKGKLDATLVKSHATTFKDLFGKEVLMAAPAAANPAAAAQHAKMTQAAVHWDGTKNMVDAKVKELVRAIKSHYAQRSPALVKGIEKVVQKIDPVIAKLDHRLTDSFKACVHATGPEREAEIRKAKAIIEEYKRIVKSERLFAHIDRNPLVKTNLQASVLDSLNKAEQSMA